MFVKASRKKYRFQSPQGALTAEDLWDIPLTSTVGKANLNDIAKVLNRTLKAADEESFVGTARKDTTVSDMLELVKYVIRVRQEESAALSLAADNKEKKERILAIIAKKKEGALESASIEELTEMVKGL
jgi:hypothetical protein